MGLIWTVYTLTVTVEFIIIKTSTYAVFVTFLQIYHMTLHPNC